MRVVHQVRIVLMCTLNITVVSLRTNLSSSAAAPAAAITVVDNREAKKPGEMGEEEEQRGTFVPAGLIAVEEHEPQVLAPAVMEKDEETCPKDYCFKGFCRGVSGVMSQSMKVGRI